MPSKTAAGLVRDRRHCALPLWSRVPSKFRHQTKRCLNQGLWRTEIKLVEDSAEVNGELIQWRCASSLGATRAASWSRPTLASASAAKAYGFERRLNEAAVYNRALTAKEIADHSRRRGTRELDFCHSRTQPANDRPVPIAKSWATRDYRGK